VEDGIAAHPRPGGQQCHRHLRIGQRPVVEQARRQPLHSRARS
jgi:hypothetical protein